MKNVLMLSLVIFLGWCFGCPLCAQTCQPNPACKAICASKKADASAVSTDAATADASAMTVSQRVVYKKSCSGATAKSDAAGVQVIPASLLDPGTVANTKSALICNPADCDPKNCDPKNCDPKNCDLSKCVPVKCAGARGSASVVRL